MSSKYHMDLDKILGKKVNFGEPNEDIVENKGPKKRFDEQDFEIIKSGPEINYHLDEMEDKLEVSYFFSNKNKKFKSSNF